jgi:hypothetical protein
MTPVTFAMTPVIFAMTPATFAMTPVIFAQRSPAAERSEAVERPSAHSGGGCLLVWTARPLSRRGVGPTAAHIAGTATGEGVCAMTGTRTLVGGSSAVAQDGGGVSEMIATSALIQHPSTVDQLRGSQADKGDGTRPARDARCSGMVESTSSRGRQRAVARGRCGGSARASYGSGPRSWRARMRHSPAGVRWHLDGFSFMGDPPAVPDHLPGHRVGRLRGQAPGGRVYRRRMEVSCGG